ncbi:hypothetical protein [Paraburkholderia oxyphila]|uniref:hypothetical protein n=1 Tax=Paraburkholderia oxyphila TaxID=614212 RepID=UPI0012EE420F|nr:hypothetical protein [Paraburkholderia oxyphila]
MKRHRCDALMNTTRKARGNRHRSTDFFLAQGNYLATCLLRTLARPSRRRPKSIGAPLKATESIAQENDTPIEPGPAPATPRQRHARRVPGFPQADTGRFPALNKST